MRARIWANLVAFVASLAAGGAWASVISYTEPPDLSNTTTPTPLGSLDIGNNTVAGSIAFNCTGQDSSGAPICTGDGRDYFSVTLPSGDQITSMTGNVSNYNSTGTGVDGVFYAPAFSSAVLFTGNGLVSIYSGALPGPGTFDVTADADIGLQSSFPSSVSYSYVFTITVAREPTTNVPEPATLALLGLGLAGIGFSRRRRLN